LCESGINVKVIQDILGHADIGTTMDIYVDVTKEIKDREIAAYESYLKEQTTPVRTATA
jgi:site-specific recombinase XerD